MSRVPSRIPTTVAVIAAVVLASAAVAGVAANPAAAATASPWQSATLVRANLAPDGSQALGGHSFFASISGTGRYVAYRTGAPNAGNNTVVRDRVTGTIKPVILRPDGGPSQASQIIRTSISADGRYVAFCSMAGDLVPGTIPFRAIRVFVRDTQAGTTTLASVDSTGKEFPADSAPAILSGDGRSVAFGSAGEVYVRRLASATTVKASVAPADEDWRWGSSGGFPSLSFDGRYIAFAHQSSGGESAVYVRDLVAGVTVRASVTSAGAWATGSEPSLSPDGRYLAFVSSAAGIASGASTGQQIYRRDLVARRNVRVSTTPYDTGGASESSDPSISAGGRYVVFASSAANLVPGDTNNDRDVFVRDIAAGTTTRINVGPGGVQANYPTGWVQPLISADGRSVVFSSAASNLVAGDTNGFEDIFVAEAH